MKLFRWAPKQSSTTWQVTEPACWNDWFAQFETEWASQCQKLCRRGVTMEQIRGVMKPSMPSSPEAVERFEHATDADLRWLTEALRDDARKWFVANLARDARSLPEALFEPMVVAGIEETSPDFNRRFIEPCLGPFGHRRVNEYLLSAIELGDEHQKAGAVNALVWAIVKVGYRLPNPLPSPLRLEREWADPEALAAYEALDDLRERERILLLETFVSNANLDVRRSILGHLDLDESSYANCHKPLVARAIQIARNTPDEYIQNRLRYQLGETGLIPALLPRKNRS